MRAHRHSPVVSVAKGADHRSAGEHAHAGGRRLPICQAMGAATATAPSTRN